MFLKKNLVVGIEKVILNQHFQWRIGDLFQMSLRNGVLFVLAWVAWVIC